MRRILFGNAKKILVILVAICLISIIGIGSYSCAIFSNSLSEQAKEMAVHKVKELEFATSKMASNIEIATKRLRENQEFCNLICGDVTAPDSMVTITKHLDEAIRGIDEISAYAAFSPSYNEWVYNILNWDQTTGIKLQIAFDATLTETDQIAWYSGDVRNIDSALNNFIICATNIPSQVDPSRKTKIYFFMDKANLSSVFADVGDQALMGIMNKNGQNIYVNDAEGFELAMLKTENLIYNMYLQGQDGITEVSGEYDDYVVAYSDSADTGLKFWCMYERNFFYQDVYNLVAVVVIVVICVLLLLVALAALVFRCYLMPINTLSKRMIDFKIGEEKQKVNLSGSKEIDVIAGSYNQMVDNINDSVNEITRKENEKREAEFKAMRYQINPHFIYNTLSSLKIMAINHGEKEISESLTMLSRVLRYSLFCTDKFTELSTEIDFVRNYINLMNIRYYGRLMADFLIDESTLDAMVPTFLIQPIIENSVMHGLNKKLNSGKECRIKISAYLKDGNLHIVVEDNGIGIDGVKLNTLLRGETTVLSSKKSIGLRNIDERIKLAYGDAYGLLIESEVGEYTRITIVLPFSN